MANARTHYNEFRSTLGGVTVEGRAHLLSARFVLALLLVIGFAFLYSGAEKISGGFDVQGYLLNVAGANGNPLEGLFLWMGRTGWFVDFVPESGIRHRLRRRGRERRRVAVGFGGRPRCPQEDPRVRRVVATAGGAAIAVGSGVPSRR